MRWLVAISLLCSLTYASFDDTVMRSDRFQSLVRSIRCMVCDNQSIADSQTSLARTMKLIVAEKMTAGESDEFILTYLRKRYGDDLLYNPPWMARTWLLWMLPYVIVLIVFVAICMHGPRLDTARQKD